jgi:hypothetical protein
MIRLSNEQQSRRMKESITRTVILNLSKIDYEVTFFNLLTLLRNERNRTKLSLQDIVDGNII